MTMRKAFKYRLYPDQAQQRALAVQFGHARFVYNWALATRKEYYKTHGKGLGFYDLKRRATELKKARPWLRDGDSQVLQAKIEDLDRAFVNFFEGRAEYPRFKSRRGKQSIRYPQRFKFDGKRTYLPKVGWVKTVFHRPLEGTPKNIAVSKTKSGEYYVSIQCEMEMGPVALTGPAVGVDVGLNHFIVLSTGEKIEHPKYLRKAERKLKRLQRRLSRKHKGGHNREKARLLVARQHEKVSRKRHDFLHKMSHRLTRQYAVLKMETLNVNGMVKNRRLAKSISDSGWGMFNRMCEYKAARNGGEVQRVGRFFPSSKTCHVCGLRNGALELRDRFWTCDGCGTYHDRDINAALVILNAPTAGAAGSHAQGDRVRRLGFRAKRNGRRTGKPKASSVG